MTVKPAEHKNLCACHLEGNLRSNSATPKAAHALLRWGGGAPSWGGEKGEGRRFLRANGSFSARPARNLPAAPAASQKPSQSRTGQDTPGAPTEEGRPRGSDPRTPGVLPSPPHRLLPAPPGTAERGATAGCRRPCGTHCPGSRLPGARPAAASGSPGPSAPAPAPPSGSPADTGRRQVTPGRAGPGQAPRSPAAAAHPPRGCPGRR